MHNSILPDSIQKIVDKLKVEKELKPCKIIQLVNEASVGEEDILPWEDFNHPTQDSYGRKLLYHGGTFEVTVNSWLPGDYSAIHDNGKAKWGAIQVFGPAEHAVFRLEDDKLTTVTRTRVKSGDVLGVNQMMIHQLGNPTIDQNILSLHIYGTDEDNDDITPPFSRIYALEKNEIQIHAGGKFFALNNHEVNSIKSGITSDYLTHFYR